MKLKLFSKLALEKHWIFAFKNSIVSKTVYGLVSYYAPYMLRLFNFLKFKNFLIFLRFLTF